MVDKDKPNATPGFFQEFFAWHNGSIIEKDGLFYYIYRGEGCFALANYQPDQPDQLLLFTGGHHSGHFYAIGEVLFSLTDPETPLEWLPRPVLQADVTYAYESGYSATEPGKRISHYRDCIFFNGLTLHGQRWMLYYGGSEYYTCLAVKDEG